MRNGDGARRDAGEVVVVVPVMLEERIREVKQAELEESATDSERGWLALARRGLGSAEAVVARIRLRQELRLPVRDCIVDADGECLCCCLSEALDSAWGGATRGEVIRAAKVAHADRLARLSKPLPPPPEPEPEPVFTQVDTSPPPPEPATAPEKPHRFYRRAPKWYDPTPRS
jgi:hypothetical protein